MIHGACAVCIFVIACGSPALAQSKSVSVDALAIEYSSVATALDALQKKSGVKFSTNEDWIIAKDTDGANWSFTPPSHPAHPSVGRRKLREHEGRFYVETSILCQATKAACDNLHADYQKLDRRMNEAIRAENNAARKR